MKQAPFPTVGGSYRWHEGQLIAEDSAPVAAPAPEPAEQAEQAQTSEEPEPEADAQAETSDEPANNRRKPKG